MAVEDVQGIDLDGHGARAGFSSSDERGRKAYMPVIGCEGVSVVRVEELSTSGLIRGQC